MTDDPALDPADANSAAVDAEIRQRYASMNAQQKDILQAEMDAGRNDKALHALLRDPMPDHA